MPGEKADLLQKLRKLKMQVMPSATFAPMLYGAGVILGGGLGIRYRDETPPEPVAYIGALLERLRGRREIGRA